MVYTSRPSVVPYASRFRRRRNLCCALLLCVLGITLVYRSSLDLSAHQQGPSVQHTDDEYEYDAAGLSKGSPLAAVKKPENISCTPTTCMRGSWVLRNPPFASINDLHAAYPPAPRGTWSMCGSEENHREPEDRVRFHAAQEKRLVDVMNWVWKPDEGKMRAWDAEAFVVRLLRSPGGLIFSGDSISRQHFNHLEYALSLSNILITEDPSHLPHHSHHRLHQFILRPDDPMTKRLQALAGVPASRLLRPIYTKMDNHILIGEEEVRRFTAALGAQEGFTWHDIFDYFEDWEDFVKDMAKGRQGEEESVKEETVLVINTGMHWSRGTFYMLPNTGSILDQQHRVTAAYKQMVNRVTTLLAPIPRLSVYYRTTAPGHPSCLARTSPYPDLPAALKAESKVRERMGQSTDDEGQKVVRMRWDWDRVEAHNHVWRDRIAELPQVDRGKGARWFYMDVWEQALQRPDAHTQNLVDPKNLNFDCLHWCVPGVVETWTEYLNHLVFWDDSNPKM